MEAYALSFFIDIIQNFKEAAMDQFDKSVEVFIENAGWMAPFFFIILHLLRPILFLPVIAVCVAGGVAFGFVQGALLSFTGLVLMSAITYFLLNRLPRFHQVLTQPVCSPSTSS